MPEFFTGLLLFCYLGKIKFKDKGLRNEGKSRIVRL